MRITSDPRLIHSFLSTTPSSESFCVSIPDCRSFSSYFFPHYYCPSLRYTSAGPQRWRLWWPLSVTALEKGEGSVKAEAVMRQSHGDAVYKFMSLSSHCFSLGHFDDDTHKHKLTHTHTQSVSQWTCRNSKSKDGSPCPPCTHSALKFDRIFLCLCFGKCLCA